VAVALTLLGDVRWRGAAVAGDRSRALLAALADAGDRPVPDGRLIELVWGDDAPANGAKALQVLVSRTRAACGADVIVRDAGGYRLGVGVAEVDSGRLGELVRAAVAALDDDAAGAQALAREALALADGLSTANGDGSQALARIRQAAAQDAEQARVLLARAGSRTGAHAEALPALEAAHARRPDDESLLADLLHSEGAVRGPGAALERYERYRRDLRERLGTSPGERLQRAHRDLLALDRPVREGVRFDATSLVGRDDDIAALRGLLASARVVSIVGPGGLGKTRLAHVLARDTTQPQVHVVELVGVTSAEDVVAEVGAVLGVRDSITARRTLTPQQRADLRSRIAQQLGQSPSVLVLDNCEHLVEAVAELVAFLVAATADLRVLTTTRAPLAIAAERVYPLGQLEVDDAARLLGERAVAARPGVQLDDAIVRRIATRLDGLPLAIELAAVKVRAMSISEIDRRLENRFSLLRGGDRGAPDRHQTLLAVIDWSWNLLDDDERRALRRLSLFHDGFTLETAEAMLGDDALTVVQGLVDQSLLSVADTPAGARYRMLETVREFGRMQLVDAGEDAEARAARRAWATAYARRQAPLLLSREQFAAIDALAAEETNLADELRDALADGDATDMVHLLAALGALWSARGAHGRLFTLIGAIADVVEDWTPLPEHEQAARAAMAVTLANTLAVLDERTRRIAALLRRLGPGESDPRLQGMIRMLLSYDPDDGPAFEVRLEQLAESPDPHTARPALQWLGHIRENAGDPSGGAEAIQRALDMVGPDDGPWPQAILHTFMAQLSAQLGDRAAAAAHARRALPVMQRLGAKDDEMQLRSMLALDAITAGDLAEAEAELERIRAVDEGGGLFGSAGVQRTGRAELALARGDVAEGLREYRACAETMRALRFPGIEPSGREPWTVFGESAALTAHAHHATGADVAHGEALFTDCRERTLRLLDAADGYLDIPVVGLALFGLGSWALLHDAAPAHHAVTLLALGDRLAYTRSVPTMAWERIAPRAEERAPGLLAAAQQRYAGRRPRDLLGEAREVVGDLRGGGGS
jgi:predicted ATPase/DNA-binding SARP family transcriptional activator